jgi:hypothetical protein
MANHNSKIGGEFLDRVVGSTTAVPSRAAGALRG